MASQIIICNNALAEIAADPINSIDEESLSARECARIWGPLLAEFMEWADWEHAIIRTVLAGQENDRAGEWRYRYAAPSDIGRIRRLVPHWEHAQCGAISGPFTTPFTDTLGLPAYMLAGGSLYTNLPDASIEYITTNIEIGRVRPLGARALELEMAARLTMAIKKSRELKGDLIKQAEVARSRAVAAEENRQHVLEPTYVSAAEYARWGST